MINPFAETDWNPSLAARRAFGKSLVIGFPIIGVVLLLLRLRGGAWPLWVAAAGMAVGVLCWMLPQIAKPIYVLWYGLGCSVGLLVANLGVGAIFYLVVTPTSFVLRCLGKDPLERRFDPEATTYWKDAVPPADKARYFQQF